MVDPEVRDWERLRKAIPAIEKPTIDESLMQVYIMAADEEALLDAYHASYVLPPDKIAYEDYEEEANQGFPNDYADEEDAVNNPIHYNTGRIECIEAIEESMSAEAFAGYLKGNCMKYLWRYDYKGKPLEDLEKAQWYLTKLRATLSLSEEDE